MNKTFAEYLTESKHTYEYRIKIVGDVDQDHLDSFKEKLKQYDVVSIKGPKKTPIQKTLMDFPGIENQSSLTFDVVFNYPAIEPQIVQMAQLSGINPNHVRMIAKNTDDADSKQTDSQLDNKDLLNSEYPVTDKDQQAAKDGYADANQDVLKNAYKSDFTIAGGKPQKAKTSNDYPQGTKSPIGGTNKLPVPKSAAR